MPLKQGPSKDGLGPADAAAVHAEGAEALGEVAGLGPPGGGQMIEVLRGVSGHAARGELVGVLGPSGKCLAGSKLLPEGTAQLPL